MAVTFTYVRNFVRLAPFAQPYCATGETTLWSRLVLLYDGNGLLTCPVTGQWSKEHVHKVMGAVPVRGMLIALVDAPADRLAALPIDAWTQHPRVGTIVVHGVYNPALCETKHHVVVVRPSGATVHILSADYLYDFSASGSANRQYAFNTALSCLADLSVLQDGTSHLERFGSGVIAPGFYEIVCVEHNFGLGYTHQSFRTKPS